MLQKSETSRWAVVKYGVATLLVFSLFVFVAACEDQSKKDLLTGHSIVVSGQILSADGTPLPGATITLQGVEAGTTTDVNGRYTLNAPDNSTVLISFIGHKSQEIPVNGRTAINAKLALGSDGKAPRVSGKDAKLEPRLDLTIPDDGKGTVFAVVEKNPEFPGGMRELGNFITKNMKYPEAAQRAHVSGKVFVSFVINTDGSIQDIQILKGIGFGADAEAVRMIKSMPRWTPGTQDGKPVRVKYNLPIRFDWENRTTTQAP